MIDTMTEAARRTTVACVLIVAAACGGQPDPDPDASGGATPANNTQSDAPVLALGEIESFTATVTGMKDTTYEGSTADDNVEPGGGCSETSPLRIGFNMLDADGGEIASLSAETDKIPAPGETGIFPVEAASFWYVRFGLPSRTTFQGSGTLEITRHDARPDARRMEGRLVARGLEDSQGDRLDLEAQFAIGLSCGMK